MKSKVSIIITSKNEEDVIGELASSLWRQTYKNIEIILVDNNSNDNTVKIAREKNIKVYNFGPERSAQRNFGASKVTGSYLLFLDADMKLEPRVVEECLEKMLQKHVGAVIIPEVSFGEGYWDKVKAFERSFYNEEGDKYTDAARFFTKEAFIKTGGYDELLTGPEDWDLSERIKKQGFAVVRISSKIYHHERIPSLIFLARKKFYYGLSASWYLNKHKISTISPKTIYFLRPVFYRNWKQLLLNPFLTMGMIVMFAVELICGGSGYLLGKLKGE